MGQLSDPGDNSLSSLGEPCGNSIHTQESLLHQTYWAALHWSTHDLGPRSAPTPFLRDQGMLSALPVGSGRMLPWSLLPALPPESLLWLTLTCYDLLRLGLTGRQDPLFLWSLLPVLARPVGIDFLGMVLPLATESQNQPSNTCSKLGLQLAQTSTDWPETLAYPHQPYSTTLQTLARRVAFPGLGRVILPFSGFEPTEGLPHLSLRHSDIHPVPPSCPTQFLSRVSSILLHKITPHTI